MILLIFAGLLPLLIVWALTRKQMIVDVPMCGQHRNHWARRTRFAWISFFVMILLLVVCIAVGTNVDPPNVPENFGWFLFLGYMVVFLIWLISLAVISQSSIRPDEITDNDITLIKLSPDFVAALWADREQYEEERRERRRQQRERDREDRYLD